MHRAVIAGDDIDPGFEAALSRLPDGYFKGVFMDRSWGVTLRRSQDGRRIWLYAEQLGGEDVVSFNLYRGAEGRVLLKPCEMSSDKVVAFVIGFRRLPS